MPSTQSRYHEVYARWKRDPAGLLGRGRAGDRLDQAGRQGVRPGSRRLWPLVRRRRVQHLLQRGRPACRPTRGDQAAIIYDSPVTGTKRGITYAELQDEVATLAAVLQDIGVKKGDRVIIYMPMIPEARLRDAGLRAHRRHPFRGVRRLRREGTRDPHRRCQAEARSSPPPAASRPRRVVPYKPLLDEAIALAAHKPEACLILQRPQAQARSPRAATMIGRGVAQRRREDARPIACRSPPPIRSTCSTPRARPASRRAWCATTAATWSR